MRKHLIAGIAAISLVAAPATAPPAYALLGVGDVVFDPTTFTQDLKSFYQQLQQYATQLQQYSTQLQQLEEAVQEVQWATNIANGLIHNPNMGQVMSLMNLIGIDNPLPVNPYAVQSLLSGYGGMNGVGGVVGKLSNLGSLVNTSYGNNHVYDCNSGDWSCTSQRYRSAGNAGLIGVVSQLYSKLNDHLQTLQGLQERAKTTVDAKDSADLQNAIGVEQAWLTDAHAQINAVAAMGQAQRQISQQQDEEDLSKQLQANIAATPGHAP